MLFPQYKRRVTTEYWSEHFSASSEKDLLEHPRAGAIIEFLEKNVSKSARIVEAGASWGRFIILLKQRGYRHVEGFDNNRKLVKKAGMSNVRFGDIFKTPYKDASFDLYIDIGTLEHFHPPDQDRILHEAKRILAADGMIALDVTYFTWKRWLLLPVMWVLNELRHLRGAEFYQYIFSVKAAKKLLKRNGFMVFNQLDRDPRMLILARRV